MRVGNLLRRFFWGVIFVIFLGISLILENTPLDTMLNSKQGASSVSITSGASASEVVTSATSLSFAASSVLPVTSKKPSPKESTRQAPSTEQNLLSTPVLSDSALESLRTELGKDSEAFLQKFIFQNEKYPVDPEIEKNLSRNKIQIQYTHIQPAKKDEKDSPATFKTYTFRVDPKRYFYPASAIKLSAVLVATDKLNNKGADILSTVDYGDNSQESKLPANYIRNVLGYSDNYSFDRLYDMIGRKELNEKLHSHGYASPRIYYKLSMEDSSQLPAYTVSKSGIQIFSEAYRTDEDLGFSSEHLGDRIIDDEDFSWRNFISIPDLQDELKQIFYPETIPASLRFNLTKTDRDFIGAGMLNGGERGAEVAVLCWWRGASRRLAKKI